MNKLLKNPSYRSNTGYSGNDLSHTIDFTSTVGQAVPVSWDILQPGDKIKQQVRLKTRTQPLVTAAFGEIEEHVRTFFVPFSQIYKPYEQLFNGIQDYGSDFYNAVIVNNRLSDILPIVSLGQLYDYLLNILPDSTETPASLFFDKFRLLEMIGLPMSKIAEDFAQGTDTTWRSHSVNLLPFMAYQKIWYDYFRDTDRIVNDPQAYNYDSWVDSTNHVISSDRLAKFLTLRYVPCKRDTTNNLFVSPVFGELGVGGDHLKILVNSVNNWLTSVIPQPVGSDGSLNDSNPTSIRPSGSIPSSTLYNGLNVASLRSAFAVNKLLEITRRAHKHYDAQILAHFGVKVPMGINGESFEVGHHEQQLVIGDVISTADTSLNSNTGAMLGEIAGKGYSHEVSDFESFEASTHGILMTIYYSRPRYVYEQTGIDKKLAYTKISDFPREEYDDLGMQPKFLMNMKLSANAASNAAIEQYEYRYSEVKTAMSRAILGMARTLKGWVITREPVFVTAEDFYVKPSDINQILAIPYSDTLTTVVPNQSAQTLRLASLTAFNSDPFMNHLLLVYKKTSKLSTYGLMDI